MNWLQISIAAGLSFLVSFGLHNLDIIRLEAKQEAAIRQQAQELQAQCSSDKKITTEVSKTYETQIMALTQQLDTVKQLHNQCVVVVSAPQPTGGHNATPTTTKPSVADGVTAAALIDFAGIAEKYRLQLNACQRFITETWAEKKQ